MEKRGHWSSPQISWKQRGFTSSELAVVVAVLSVLAALVVPIVANTRAKTRLSQCIANLQQINRAVLLYAEDQQGRIPLLDPSPTPGGWWYFKEQVKGYAGTREPSSTKDKLFACPMDRGYSSGTDKLEPFCLSKKHNYTSYVLNGVTLPGVPNIAGWQIASVKDPARTLLVMEWTAHAPLSWHKSRTGKANTLFYNDAESVVGFVDGHVALIKIYYDGINAAYTRDPIGGYDYKYSGD